MQRNKRESPRKVRPGENTKQAEDKSLNTIDSFSMIYSFLWCCTSKECTNNLRCSACRGV